MERIRPVARVAREAAASDSELAALMEVVKATRREEMVGAAEILAGRDGLRVDVDEAAATLDVLVSPQLADMLMEDHGWSPQQYETWLARMVLATVIRAE